jgi:hypothetical protein
VEKSNVYETPGLFGLRVKLALMGVLLFAGIALRHYYEFLLVPIFLGLVAYIFYRVLTDPVNPPKG